MLHCDSQNYTLENIQCQVRTDRQVLGTNPWLTIILVHHDESSYATAKDISRDKDIYLLVHIPTTKYFESIIYTKNVFQLIPLKSEYTGVITYSFQRKKGNMDIEQAMRKNPGHDVYALFGWHTKIKHHLENEHGVDFHNMVDIIMKKLGMSDWREAPAFFCNFWIAKTPIFIEYAKFANKVISMIENDEGLSKWMNKDSYYQGALLGTELLQKMSNNYYTRHSFFMERLVCVWLHHHNYNVFYL